MMEGHADTTHGTPQAHSRMRVGTHVYGAKAPGKKLSIHIDGTVVTPAHFGDGD